MPLLWKRWRTVLWITVAGAIGGVIASFLMTPLFKSTAVVFPALSNSASHSLLNEYSDSREDILGIGDEEDAEHLIQVLSSARVRDRIIAQRDLMTSYGIQADDPYRQTKAARVWKDLVDIRFTRFGSVEISVLDPVPERAAIIANDILDLVDTVWIEMEMERIVPGVELLKKELDQQRVILKHAEDSLRTLQRTGVNDYRSQSERFNAELAKAIGRGDDRAVKALEARMNKDAELASRYISQEHIVEFTSARLVSIQAMVQKAEIAMSNRMPRKLVLDRALPADKKHFPVRWLVVLMATLAAMVLSLVLIVVQESVQKLRR